MIYEVKERGGCAGQSVVRSGVWKERSIPDELSHMYALRGKERNVL